MCALCFCSAVMTSTRALNSRAGCSHIRHKRTPVYQTQTKLYPWIVAGIFVFCDRFLHSPGARNSSISVIRPYFKLKVNLPSKPPAKPRVSARRELVRVRTVLIVAINSQLIFTCIQSTTGECLGMKCELARCLSCCSLARSFYLLIKHCTMRCARV